MRKKIKLRTWISIGIIGILLPIAILRAIYSIIAAPPVANTRWTFDEAQGATAQDYSTNDNDGTITGATWVEKDRCLDGNCLSYDGADDRVARSAGDDADMDFAAADSFTISLWYRHSPESAGTDVIAVKLEAVGTDGGYIIQEESDGDITCAIEDDDADTTIDDTISSTAATYDDNKWHHVACVKSGTASLTLYIDSNQVAQDASLDAASTLENDETFYLGADNAGTTNEFTGFIDEFRMYRSALTAAEIIVDFNFGAAARFADQPSDFLTEGLVGYWKMDEGADNTCTIAAADACDSSGNGYDGTKTAMESADWVGAKFGNGLQMGGTDEYVDAGDVNQLDSASTVTIASWVRRTAAGNIIEISKSSGNNSIIDVELWSDGNIYFAVGDGTNMSTGDGSTLNDTSWHHVVLVFDGRQTGNSNRLKGYVDGQERTLTITGTVPATTGNYSRNFFIGRGGETADLYTTGYFDETRIYNRTLSPAEVRALYNWAPGPTAYFKLDEATGQNVTDSSGNGIAATFGNSSSVESVDPLWTLGKFGSAARTGHTDGDEAINIATSNLFDVNATGSFTISMWIRRIGSETFQAAALLFDNWNFAPGWDLGMNGDVDSNTLFWDLDDNTQTHTVTSTTGFSSNTAWTHIAAVLDRTSTATTAIYINGVKETVTTSGDALSTIDGLVSSQEECIGGDSTGTECRTDNTLAFNGEIDEVRFYNYPRTAQQIVEDMNAGHPTGGSPIGSQAVWWKFDEQYSTTAQDLADSVQSDGTISGTSVWLTSTSCKINGCLNFDAAGEVVTVATASDTEIDYNGSEKFSFSAWVYVVTAPGASDEDIIIGKWDETAAAELRGYRLYITDADTDNAINLVGELYDESANQAISAATTSEPIALNTWYHVVLTHNGGVAGTAGDLETYINGLSVATNSANASFLGVDDVASDFTVGDYDATDAFAGNTTFTGRIDDVQVYSDELTADQVKIVMNAGSAASYSVLSTTSEEADVAGSQGNPPVGDWKMDEGSWTNNCSTDTVFDSSGNSLNGDACPNSTGPIGGAIGKYGNAGDFDGSNDYVYLGSPSTLNLSGEMSIFAWIKPDNLTADQDIIGQCSTGAGGQFELDLGIGANDNKINVWWGNTAIDNSTTNLTTGQWYHVGWVRTGSSGNWTSGIYINGALDKTTTGIATNAGSQLATAIGRCGDYTVSNWFNGVIDEVKIYNYARTPAQIAYDFNRGGPIGWWKMDDCTGTNVNDLSLNADLGSAKDGTWSGTTAPNTGAGTCSAVDTATAWYNGRNGKYNSSLDFDGVDDQVAVTNVDAIDLNVGLLNGFTFAAWVYPNSDGETDVGEIFDKGTNTYCRTDTESASRVDIECRLDLTTDAAFNVSSAIPINQWSHIAFSWTQDADDEVTIWINGVANTSVATFDGTAPADANNLTIGGTPNFDGQIDDFRIYPYELGTAQIRKVMNEGSGARFGPVTGSP